MHLVSTVIPVFNRPNLLRDAVESVLSQTHRPIEIVIIDDGSDDGITPAEIANLVSENPGLITACRIPNSGPGAARQAGLSIAKGEFIQFLDSDDLLEPTKFDLQLTALQENPDCDVAYGMTRQYTIGDEPNDDPIRRTGEQIETMFPAHLKGRWWSTSTPLFRRSILDLAGPWKSFRSEEDWEFECRVASLGTRLAYVKDIVSTKREHSGAQLGDDSSIEPSKLKDRAEVHELIYNHAIRARIPVQSTDMKSFARSVFLLSRQCGSIGLTEQSRGLFELAQKASTPERARKLDFLVYRHLALILGWKNVGRLAQRFDALRDSIASFSPQKK